MTAYRVPEPRFRAFDTNGAPLSGGKLATYITGTSTPTATWTTSTQEVQNSNPIILDVRGEADVWIPANTPQRWVVTDSLDIVQYDRDPMTAFVTDSALLLAQAGLLALQSVVLQAVPGSAPLVAPGFHAANQTVFGVKAEITTQFGASGGLTGLTIGDPGRIDRWADAMPLTTGVKPTRQGGLPRFLTATDLIISPLGGNFANTGTITLTAVLLGI